MLKRDDWFDNGIRMSRSEYRAYKRKKMVLATLISVALCSALLGAFKAQESLSVMATRAYLFESYESVVLNAMNGDARFQVGNELFECKGGYLGPAT